MQQDNDDAAPGVIDPETGADPANSSRLYQLIQLLQMGLPRLNRRQTHGTPDEIYSIAPENQLDRATNYATQVSSRPRPRPRASSPIRSLPESQIRLLPVIPSLDERM